MDYLDFEGIAIISMIIFELILFVKTSIDLFKNTWWDDDMDGL
jgi:hypothetical protein